VIWGNESMGFRCELFDVLQGATMNISTWVKSHAIAAPAQACVSMEARVLCAEEVEQIAGGTGSNSYASTYQGGNDGYGGGRRNP
jgi:hypothetical protein